MAKKSKKSNPEKTTVKPGSIEKIVAAVNAAARDQAAAESAAAAAVTKAAAKKAVLKEARAAAAAAATRAKRALRELQVAKLAATKAAEDEKTAAKKAKKAAKARKAAEKSAVELADKTRAAREKLDALPPAARGLTEIATAADAEETDTETAGAEPAPTPEQTTADLTAQSAEPVEELPTAIPSELRDETHEVAVPQPNEDGPEETDAPTEASSGALLPVTDVLIVTDGPTVDWTLARLRLLARERGIRGYSAMSKARLYEVLTSSAD